MEGLKCLICDKEATYLLDGYSFCRLHYDKSYDYPDRDLASYVKQERKNQKR